MHVVERPQCKPIMQLLLLLLLAGVHSNTVDYAKSLPLIIFEPMSPAHLRQTPENIGGVNVASLQLIDKNELLHQ